MVSETADWREIKVSYDTGYLGERMYAYLFLPKNVHPPYQTILFSPSARVLLGGDNSKGGKGLLDIQFFQYVVQSGRAVMYPIYQDMYERRVKYSLPGGAIWTSRSRRRDTRTRPGRSTTWPPGRTSTTRSSLILA